jgi:hypothetical protein
MLHPEEQDPEFSEAIKKFLSQQKRRQRDS